ncbi:MAG: zinc ABC transporter substrate-binding protein [Clostridia bacterium]|nr:zinc ABC transporter substrate-binding protein [Clostridia bacterium]
MILLNGINFIETEEFEHKHGIEEDEEEEHHHHSEKYDAHIWLDPTISIQMVNNIEKEIAKYDSKNASYYSSNTDTYINELEALDNDFYNVVLNGKTKKIAFGGPFAYAYFIERYGLDFISAYDSCGENGEPSVFKLKEVIDYINNNKLHVIFYKELSSGSIAKTISEETGAEMLEFNSLHTVTDKELEDNVSYIEIMRKNLDNLKKALN